MIYTVAYIFLLLALLFAAGGACMGGLQLWGGKSADLGWVEKSNLGVAACLFGASYLLLYALIVCDFSLDYVASYTDRALPLFYRLTAFWAGQAGSLLFWALMVAVCGVVFQFTAAYRALQTVTKLWFWLFFLTIMAFFGLLLTCWSNPFLRLPFVPADGRGLNPLLQNPGMIFHPPLLFLGYGGFVIPGCLALAQAMRRAGTRNMAGASEVSLDCAETCEASWLMAARPFTLTGWLFLTAGIVLGAWWAYMELGWGGYWAWDPVENASLLPWLLATAAIHTGIIEARRDKLHKVNIFLMALTTVSAFFATYLVRGNVVQSVHAFGEGGVGAALLIFVLLFLFVAALVALQGGQDDSGGLNGLETREGFLVMTAWLLIALALVILFATLWPVISSLWAKAPEGLNARFYNSVCLPLFAVLLALLAVCPWLGWRGGVRDWRRLGVVLAVFGAALGLFWATGTHSALPLMASALCAAALASMGLMLADSSVRGNRPSMAAYLVHVGLVLVALGIVFSGPGKTEVEIELAKGATVNVGPYTAQLKELYEGRDGAGTYQFIEAEVVLSRNGKPVAVVSPQRRAYTKFGEQGFSEAATHFSLGNEFYAALLGINSEQQAILRLSVHPLVNWLWIGGTLMTLAPLLGLGGRAARRRA